MSIQTTETRRSLAARRFPRSLAVDSPPPPHQILMYSGGDHSSSESMHSDTDSGIGSTIATVDEHGPSDRESHHQPTSSRVDHRRPPMGSSPTAAQAPEPLQHGCVDVWNWSKKYRSPEVLLSGVALRTAYFHPNWSKGSAGVRGTKMMNNGRYYWEIQVTKRIFGTSMMFGIGTDRTALHANAFQNLLGENKHSWGLSHKGLIWHGGVGQRYTKCFNENQATTIGILFDGIDGTLTYYKDGVSLGIAFRGLNQITEPIYPIICSTAAKTEMILSATRRDFVSLQDRCRAEICKTIRIPEELDQLDLPPRITKYLAEAVPQVPPPGQHKAPTEPYTCTRYNVYTRFAATEFRRTS